MKFRQLTPAIGAQVSEVHLGEVSRDPAMILWLDNIYNVIMGQ